VRVGHPSNSDPAPVFSGNVFTPRLHPVPCGGLEEKHACERRLVGSRPLSRSLSQKNSLHPRPPVPPETAPDHALPACSAFFCLAVHEVREHGGNGVVGNIRVAQVISDGPRLLDMVSEPEEFTYRALRYQVPDHGLSLSFPDFFRGLPVIARNRKKVWGAVEQPGVADNSVCGFEPSIDRFQPAS
jgi:hypothetical protein